MQNWVKLISWRSVCPSKSSWDSSRHWWPTDALLNKWNRSDTSTEIDRKALRDFCWSCHETGWSRGGTSTLVRDEEEGHSESGTWQLAAAGSSHSNDQVMRKIGEKVREMNSWSGREENVCAFTISPKIARRLMSTQTSSLLQCVLPLLEPVLVDNDKQAKPIAFWQHAVD